MLPNRISSHKNLNVADFDRTISLSDSFSNIIYIKHKLTSCTDESGLLYALQKGWPGLVENAGFFLMAFMLNTLY